MEQEIEKLKKEVLNFDEKDISNLTEIRNRYLGKNGILNKLFLEFKHLSIEDKKKVGAPLNELKTIINEKLNKNQKTNRVPKFKSNIDFTLPGVDEKIGSIHPISHVTNKIIKMFREVGFGLSSGPEIEDDWHNFTALNMPESHPARDMQDTFFVSLQPDMMLRTHTSSVQVRYMESNKPPIRIISPGRVFRNEDISARSHCLFHQIEGLCVDENINFSDLKLIIKYFINNLFGKNTKIRFRPSFFPFTEPSAEVDIFWGLNSETDYRITKGTGWLEIMGCGMVDPKVLKNVNINPEKYSGYAFGMGIERIAMLLYQIDDIRLFYENDKRFLSQFKGLN
ncbi:MAG: phenylalanine--tRNA ligase subunit alpha [Flavobacteriales bacterium]|nr:phenylalanine--tRNA ligase subunit alpha [Flavobacteriales bacterium]